MNDSTSKTISELEARIRHLEAENDQLAERAEDTLLLGQISETISRQTSVKRILSSGLECISLLKDIPVCMVIHCQQEKNKVTAAYLSYTSEDITGLDVIIPADIKNMLVSTGAIIRLAEQSAIDMKDQLPEQYTVGQTLWIHDQSIACPGNIYAFIFSPEEATEQAILMQPMLQRVTEIMTHAMDRLIMVESLQELNAGLDRKVEKRTAALKKSKQHFRSLIDQAPDAIFLIDDHGNIIKANRTASLKLGYSRKELLKMKVPDIDINFSIDGVEQLNKNTREGCSTTFEGLHKKKDGVVFPVEVHLSRISYGKESCLLALARDISERKRAETTIRMHQRAMDAAANGVIITDARRPDMPVIYCNKAAQTISGYSNEEILGKNCRFLQGDGTDQPEIRRMRRAIAKQQECTVTLRNIRKNGDIFWNEVSLSPVFDETGRLIEYIGIQCDVTYERDLEEQLAQSQKMEAVGTLVGGIAHDFNNMLAGMMGNLYLMQKDVSASEILKSRAETIQELCERAATMISQLLTFARKGPVRMQSINIKEFLEENIPLSKMSIPENICFEYVLESPENIHILGDRTQLQQVLLNLLVNARDAVADKPKPTIRVELKQIEQNTALNAIYDELGEGPWIELSVADNGCGIPEVIKDRVFDPFYTTKEVGKGTGLGLSMVYGAIQSHQGTIRIESEKDKGTCFYIYLPIHGGREKISENTLGDLLHGYGETILLVDDDEVVRTSVKELLEHLGYRVELACNGRQAVKHKALKDVNLVIMDVVMPELGGVDAAVQLRQRYPHLPVLFATSYDRNQVLQHQEALTNSATLCKPFRLKSFSGTLRNLLEGHEGNCR